MLRAEIQIDLKNILFNFEKIREVTGYGQNVIPTVKGNAYNVGVYNVVRGLLSLKVPQKKYFVFALQEGIELRKMFQNLEKIFILGGISKGDEEFFVKYNLTPVVNSFEQLELCKNFEINEVIIHFNTGMNRSGININELKKIKQYCDENSIRIYMVMSHFCCADNKLSNVNEIQINNFKKVADCFSDKNILKGISASDGIANLNSKLDFCNTCRPGLALYGYYEGLKPAYSIYSHVEEKDGKLYLPLGINNGFTSDYGNKNSYVIIDNNKIFVDSIEDDKIILSNKDKTLIGKKVTILGNGISFQDFEKMNKTDIRDIVARIISNCDINPNEFKINIERKRIKINESNFKAKYKIENGKFDYFYSTILEKREVEDDGIVGYGATKIVKKGDKLATFFGGYLDGMNRSISNSNSFVFIENKNNELIKCEIFGKISMDQTTIKIPNEEFNKIDIGAKVIIFDSNHKIESFENNTNKNKNELFFYLNKSSRIQ